MNSKLKEVRIKEGLTITELSKKSGVSTRTIQRIEKGEANFKPETLNRILNTLNQLSRKNFSFEFIFDRFAG